MKDQSPEMKKLTDAIVNADSRPCNAVNPPRLAAALRYARRGWRVIPVSDKKIPLIKSWPELASTDSDQIHSWWDQFPNANVGIATGEKSGIWVLDIDVKNGVDGLKSLIDAFGNPSIDDKDYCVNSPSGGYHLYFKWDSSLPITVAANILEGVDIRGENGFIMSPPSSVIVEGEERHYTENNTHYNVPDAPAWAKSIAAMTLKTDSQATPSKHKGFDLTSVINGVQEGDRDTSLFRYACHLRGCEVPYDLAEGFILEAAARCKPPFDEAIVLEKLQRAFSTIPARAEIFSLEAE